MKPRPVLIALAIGLPLAAGVCCYAWIPPAAAPLEPADRIVVSKSRHVLTLFRNGQEMRSYSVSTSRHPLGAKMQSRDHKTPEGQYQIDSRNPRSGFHRALHVSYPNQEDRVRAANLGVNPGGDIMIHGIKNGLGWIGRFQRWMDWTDGCIAVTDAEMDQIYQLVPDGTPVEIHP